VDKISWCSLTNALDSYMTDELNPYEAPQTPSEIARQFEPILPETSAERIRGEYIAYERMVRTIGVLMMSFGAVMCSITFFSTTRSSGRASMIAIVITSLCLIASIGLVRLENWGRWLAIALSVIGLVYSPFLALSCATILYLLVLSEDGRFVFTPEYHEVMKATQHSNYATSTYSGVFLLLGAITLALLAAFYYLEIR
jgi:hypothetical protein